MKCSHELSQLTHDLPRMYELKSASKEINSRTIISPTPGHILGVQQRLRDRLVLQLHHRLKDSQFLSRYHTNKHINIKLSGGGTRVGRNLHVVNFTFTLVDEPQATSVAGHHTLAILEMSEHYDELSASLQDIADEVNDLSQLELDGEFYQLQYFLGGDWKF